MSREVEKGISETVGCLKDPIIVFDEGWGETIPKWLKDRITLERLAENMLATVEGRGTIGTDAEVAAYLYTASLTQPPSHNWAQIYLYVAGKILVSEKMELPSDVKVELLDRDQVRELADLKGWIYKQRTKARLERDKAERRKKKEIQ